MGLLPSSGAPVPLRTFWPAYVGVFGILSRRSASTKDIRDPKLKSSSVLIIDQSDSSVLYSRHPDVAAPIASITKLMTALVVLDAKQPLDEPLQITDADRDLPEGRRFRGLPSAPP